MGVGVARVRAMSQPIDVDPGLTVGRDATRHVGTLRGARGGMAWYVDRVRVRRENHMLGVG